MNIGVSVPQFDDKVFLFHGNLADSFELEGQDIAFPSSFRTVVASPIAQGTGNKRKPRQQEAEEKFLQHINLRINVKLRQEARQNEDDFENGSSGLRSFEIEMGE